MSPRQQRQQNLWRIASNSSNTQSANRLTQAATMLNVNRPPDASSSRNARPTSPISVLAILKEKRLPARSLSSSSSSSSSNTQSKTPARPMSLSLHHQQCSTQIARPPDVSTTTTSNIKANRLPDISPPPPPPAILNANCLRDTSSSNIQAENCSS